MKPHRIVLLGSILSVVNLAATTLVGFFLMPFFVHRLGDRLYGYWTLVGAVLGYYGILDLGIGRAVQFQVAKAIGAGDRESPNRALSTAVVAFTGLGLVALAITALVATFAPMFISAPGDVHVFRVVLLTMGVGFALGFPGRALMGAVGAHLRNDLVSIVGIIVLIIRTTLIVLAVGNGKGLVALAVISMLCEAGIYFANYLILRRIHDGLQLSISLASRKTFHELFDYGRFSVLIQVADQLRFAVDAWMVAVFVGVNAVAHYAIASRLSNYFLSFIISIVAVLGAWFTQLLGAKDFDGIRRILFFGTRVATCLSTIVLCSFALYGRIFITQWVGPQYTDAYWPSVLLIGAVYFDLAQQPSVTYLLGVSRHRYLAYQTIIEGAANLALSIYWAHFYGMIGVALGTLVPMVVAKLFVQPVYVCRSAGISLSQYYGKILGHSAAVPAFTSLAIWALYFRKVEFPNLAATCLALVGQGAVSAIASFFFVFASDERQRIISKFWNRQKVRQQPAESPNAA
jgi:O-antigen/teichoic acid export membrane protein